MGRWDVIETTEFVSGNNLSSAGRSQDRKLESGQTAIADHQKVATVIETACNLSRRSKGEIIVLTTQRLILRHWRESDRDPFAQMNADAEVMEYFPAPLARQESDAMIGRMKRHHQDYGFGLWAVEEAATHAFVGLIGLNMTKFQAHFTPAVEVGWRLAHPFWGKGYATEGARKVISYGFDVIGLTEIVSFTATSNQRSIAVMKRLGMTSQETDDFDHPHLPPGHVLQRHVLYRLNKKQVELSQ